MKWTLALTVIGIVTCCRVAAANDAAYQYAVPVAHRTAYLWVPPDCRAVRGVLAAFANLTERRWLEDPVIRVTAAKECLGVLWIGPGDESALNADLKTGARGLLQQMFRDLAVKSGFLELEYVPVIPMGHSAHGQFAWRFAELFPQRTIAAIPIKTVPLPADLDLPSIPLLYLVGETTEWPQYRDGRQGDRDFFWPRVRDSALRVREADPESLIAVATDPGGGHFDWSPRDAKLVALFIREACRYRLPVHVSGNGPITLRPVTYASGWLTDSAGVLPDKWPPAPVAKYRGDPSQAYWFFDRKIAMAADAFNGDRIPRKKQMLTFEQDGELLPVATQGFAALRFEPEADGVTFQLTPAFLPALPQELVGASLPLGHANGPIHLSVITGPAVQVGPYTFRIAMGRGDDSGDIWIEEEQDGDAEFRKAVQPGKLHVPVRLTEGAPQNIRFDPIPDVKGNSSTIHLHAVSSAGLPVRYYVEYGPAQVVGDRLVLTQIPKFAKRAIEIKVVAYQWGRMANGDSPAIQTAPPVTRTFLVMPFKVNGEMAGAAQASDAAPVVDSLP